MCEHSFECTHQSSLPYHGQAAQVPVTVSEAETGLGTLGMEQQQAQMYDGVEEQVLDVLLGKLSWSLASRAACCRATNSLSAQLSQHSSLLNEDDDPPGDTHTEMLDSLNSHSPPASPVELAHARCPSCGKAFPPSGFTRHLERCMGRGRSASRGTATPQNKPGAGQQLASSPAIPSRKKGNAAGNGSSNIVAAHASASPTASGAQWEHGTPAPASKKKGKSGSKEGTGSNLNTKQMHDLRKQLNRTISTHQLREHLHGLAYYQTIERVASEMAELHPPAAATGSGPVAQVKSIRECVCGVESKRDSTKGRLCQNQPRCPTHGSQLQSDFWQHIFTPFEKNGATTFNQHQQQMQQQQMKRKREAAFEVADSPELKQSQHEPSAKQFQVEGKRLENMQPKQEDHLYPAQAGANEDKHLNHDEDDGSAQPHDVPGEQITSEQLEGEQQEQMLQQHEDDDDDEPLLDEPAGYAAGAGSFLLG